MKRGQRQALIAEDVLEISSGELSEIAVQIEKLGRKCERLKGGETSSGGFLHRQFERIMPPAAGRCGDFHRRDQRFKNFAPVDAVPGRSRCFDAVLSCLDLVRSPER